MGDRSDSGHFEAILSRTMGPGEDRGKDCPDSALLAAYRDRSLPPGDQSRIEDHLDGCARCRAELAAIATAETDAPGAGPRPRANRAARPGWWTNPLAGAMVATAVAVVVAMGMGRELFEGERQGEPPHLNAAGQIATPAAPAPQAPGALASGAGSAQTAMAVAPNPKELLAGRMRRVPVEDAAAPPPAAASESLRPVQPRSASAPVTSWVIATAASPGNLVRWEVGAGGEIRRIDNGARTQSIQVGVATDLLAVSAPSTAVCWIAGRNGVVLRTGDGGAHWLRLGTPAPTDLVSITAQNARDAAVVTADSRRYSTTDGGRTWHSP